jgi:endonuclease YncB( thermonuclease family)
MYTYKAKVNKVVDGDTVNLTIDLGFRMTMTANCRLAGINAPEMSTKEGSISKLFLSNLIPVGSDVTIESAKLDKYGRPVVRIGDINDRMISEGMAVKYMD